MVVDAAQVGYVSRRRAFWACGPHGTVWEHGGRLPPDWVLERPRSMKQTDAKYGRLDYVGVKAIPGVVHLEAGFRLAIDPRQIVKAQGHQNLLGLNGHPRRDTSRVRSSQSR